MTVIKIDVITRPHGNHVGRYATGATCALSDARNPCPRSPDRLLAQDLGNNFVLSIYTVSLFPELHCFRMRRVIF